MVKPLAHVLVNFLIFLGMMITFSASAQSWMPGYNYRKSITINKAQVSGAVALLDFPVLISLNDPDLRYLAEQCNNNKLFSPTGLDISFAAASAPENTLKFQLDTYDPVAGTLNCWVNIPALTASGSAAANTVIYLYYGSNIHHDPWGTNATATWTSVMKLWHMNLDAAPASSRNAKAISVAEMAKGTGIMNGTNFVAGKIGAALKLNGSNESMNASRDSSATFTISAWIKLNKVDNEQVLISNDSIGVGGYTIKVNAAGKLIFDVKKGAGTVSTISPNMILLANQWYNIAISRDGKLKEIYINGKIAISQTKTDGVGIGGRISIGRSKQNDRFFGGLIDELRISDQVKSVDWLRTEYNNQNDPASFYVIGAEEKNPVPTTTGYLFTAAVNSNWSDPGNWNLGRIPESYANVVIKAFTSVTMRDAPEVRLNQLTIEEGARLTVENIRLVVCKTQLNDSASLFVSGGQGLQFNGEVFNNGLISTDETTGTVIFAGNQASTLVAGSGSMRTFHLQIDQAGATNTVNLNQAVVVTGKLELKSGILNSNGKLTLAASAQQVSALLPISNLSSATVIGDVVVEKYVAGSFPSPATARGWRLWSSPVYSTQVNGSPEYDLSALKSYLFITGKGGAANGFDDSPQNGNTIFTHDQSIVGNLSQKYLPIPSMSVHVSLGRGIYVYSRGSRARIDAFQKQVLSPPFINPEPYTLRYTGKLFSGDLKVSVNSRNRKEPGDGFNLLGNPYASAIRWGTLVKENTTAFVWLFNPLNNAYDVSEDPECHIPIGEGFFVKLSDGASAGSVTFKEESKISGTNATSNSAPSFLSSAQMSNMNTIPAIMHRKLTAEIRRGAFNQKYTLKVDPYGSDEITDEDALSLGEGYVNIASLSADKQKLVVDSRGIVDKAVSVPLYVKGWASGTYDLNFFGMDSFQPEDSIILVDNYVKTTLLLTAASNHYTFKIDTDMPQSQGSDRFSLHIQIGEHRPEPPVISMENVHQIRIYPNPFTDNITLTAAVALPEAMEVVISNLMGQPVLRRKVNTMEQTTSVTLDAGILPKGIYIIELRDRKINKRLKTAKIIKL